MTPRVLQVLLYITPRHKGLVLPSPGQGEVVSSSRRCSALTKILLCFFYFTKEPKASGYSCTNERRIKWHERGAWFFPAVLFGLSKRTEVQAKPRLLPKCAARGNKLTPDLNSPTAKSFSHKRGGGSVAVPAHNENFREILNKHCKQAV